MTKSSKTKSVEVLTAGEAAERKGCDRVTIHRAWGAGRINGRKSPTKRLLIFADKAFEEWAPGEGNGRPRKNAAKPPVHRRKPKGAE